MRGRAGTAKACPQRALSISATLVRVLTLLARRGGANRNEPLTHDDRETRRTDGEAPSLRELPRPLTRELQSAPPSLTAAIRRARTDEAERSEVVAELRGAERARLEMLADALAPVFAQVPEDIDIFDAGLVPGERPRLWVDIIAFIEMGRDRRQFRFVQNTRHGRVTIAESEKLDTMVDAVTAYVARRIVEREQALAADRTGEEAAREPVKGVAPKKPAVAAAVAGPQKSGVARRRFGFARLLLAFVDFVGALVLFIVLAGASYWAWKTGWALWTAHR